MRTTRSLPLVLLLPLTVGLFACSKKATAPDPNALMYGRWVGTLVDTVQTPAGPQTHTSTLELVIGKRGVGYTLDGIAYATALRVIQDPEIIFGVANRSLVVSHEGVRSADTLTGRAGRGVGRTEVWSVIREPVPSDGGSVP